MDVSTFEQELHDAEGAVLVDFFGQSCPPCRMMSPVLDEIGRERSDVRILKLDAYENQEITARHNVSAVPTFFLYVGGVVKAQFTGTKTKSDLLSWIDQNK